MALVVLLLSLSVAACTDSGKGGNKPPKGQEEVFSSEVSRAIPLVVDGDRTVQDVAYVYVSPGTAFEVDLPALVRVLGGTVEFPDESQAVVSLNGKRILIRYAEGQGEFDGQVKALIAWVNKNPRINGSAADSMIKIAYSSGGIVREGLKVVLSTR